jgi:hypothetical protein
VLFALLILSAGLTLLLLVTGGGPPVTAAALLTGALAAALLIARRPLAQRRAHVPKSQIAEIEKLYFRATREMLTDSPNMPQGDQPTLQRIISI